MTHIDGVKLLEWLKKEFYSAKARNDEGAMLAYQNIKYELDTNTFDLLPTDVDVKEIETRWYKDPTLLSAPSVVANRAKQDIRLLLTKLVEKEVEVERLKAEIDRRVGFYDEARTELWQQGKKLNQAIEALEEIANTWSVDHVYRDIANGALQFIKGGKQE